MYLKKITITPGETPSSPLAGSPNKKDISKPKEKTNITNALYLNIWKGLITRFGGNIDIMDSYNRIDISKVWTLEQLEKWGAVEDTLIFKARLTSKGAPSFEEKMTLKIWSEKEILSI